MTVNLTLDPETLHEQSAFLRGLLASRTLTDKDRFLVIDLLRIVNGLKASAQTGRPDTLPGIAAA